MDEKWMGFWRHVMNSVGAFMTAYGVMDEATWAQFSGPVLMLIPFIWSWMSKDA